VSCAENFLTFFVLYGALHSLFNCCILYMFVGIKLFCSMQPNFLNKNMQRLCGLPLLFTEHFLLGSILLSGWFTVQFAARLDSAMCGSSVRGKFLSLIASSSVLLIDEGGRSQRNKKGSLYCWAKTRGVKLRTLYMQYDRSCQLEEYLRIFGGSIRDMVFPIAQSEEFSHSWHTGGKQLSWRDAARSSLPALRTVVNRDVLCV
jgi:hypothetical protein